MRPTSRPPSISARRTRTCAAALSRHVTHYTLHTTHHTLYTRHYTPHNTQCTLNTTHYTLHTTHEHALAAANFKAAFDLREKNTDLRGCAVQASLPTHNLRRDSPHLEAITVLIDPCPIVVFPVVMGTRWPRQTSRAPSTSAKRTRTYVAALSRHTSSTIQASNIKGLCVCVTLVLPYFACLSYLHNLLQ